MSASPAPALGAAPASPSSVTRSSTTPILSPLSGLGAMMSGKSPRTQSVLISAMREISELRSNQAETVLPAATISAHASYMNKSFVTWSELDACVRSHHNSLGRILHYPKKPDTRLKGRHGGCNILVCASDLCTTGRIVARMKSGGWEVTEDSIDHKQCPEMTTPSPVGVLAQNSTLRDNILEGKGLSLKQTRTLARSTVNVALSNMQSSRLKVRVVHEEFKKQQAEYAMLFGLLYTVINEQRGGAAKLWTRAQEGSVGPS